MNKQSAIEQLNSVIEETAKGISAFTYSATAFTRNRKLDAATTIQTTLNMHGNSLNAELLEAFPNLEDRMTASAYEQAKGKLKPEVFEHIFHKYNKTMTPRLFNGKYRLLAIDGSDFGVPYSPDSSFRVESSETAKSKNGVDCKPYSIAHANLLYDIANRTYEDCTIVPKDKCSERDEAITMLKRADLGEYIVVLDRGYDGFNMIENFNRIEGCNYIVRTKAGYGAIKEIAELPNEECDVEMTFRVTTSNKYYVDNHASDPYLHLITHHKKQYKKYLSPNTRNQRWDFGTFCNIKCRVVKFRINNSDTGKEEWEVLITNLNRFEFPIETMKELYHMRWDIETSFRELKYALGGINFHSKKDNFIRMEIFAHLIMFNVVSRNIAAVSVPKTNHKHKYAIDFKMACLLTRKYFAKFCKENKDLIFAELLSYINPVRPGRNDKRNMRPKSAVWFVYRVA